MNKDIITDKFTRLIALIMISGLFSLILTIHDFSISKLFLGIFILLIVITFLYQKTKFGFGVATLYTIIQLCSWATHAYTQLSLAYSDVGFFNLIGRPYPSHALLQTPEGFIYMIILISSAYALILLYFNYWQQNDWRE